MKILIVDDNPLMQQLGERVLGDAGYTVTSFANGRDALAACAQEAPALVLVDLYLPDMEGPELLASLRTLPGCATVPALVMSGIGDVEVLARIAPGFDGYLPKPIDLDVLLESVQGHLTIP